MPKLTPNPNNPRTISKEAFEQLKGKIQRNPDGLSANKIVYKDGIIIAGNQRWRAIQDLKLEVKDDWLKDVSGWTDEQIREYLVTSNISDGDWDWDTLLNEYGPQELEDWGLETPGLEDDKEIEEDEAPEVTEDPVSELGKIYQLGRHRVMCGDSTDFGTVSDLLNGRIIDMVYTDPPYGINEKGDRSNRGGIGKGGLAKARKYDDFIDDSIEYAIKAFEIVKELGVKRQVWWGANYYAHHIPQSNNWFVWDKRVEEKQHDTQSDCELAWVESEYSSIRIFRHLWKGMMKGSENGQGRVHPTQKPIALAQWAFEYFKSVDTILDLFLGSGSTLIACEQTNRTCYGMELDPKYVDVIRKRYAKFIQPDNQLPENWEELTPEVTND